MIPGSAANRCIGQSPMLAHGAAENPRRHHSDDHPEGKSEDNRLPSMPRKHRAAADQDGWVVPEDEPDAPADQQRCEMTGLYGPAIAMKRLLSSTSALLRTPLGPVASAPPAPRRRRAAEARTAGCIAAPGWLANRR
jgi:hypothetical protein